MHLSELLDALPEAGWQGVDPSCEITGVTSRSSEVTHGSLFVCLRGLHLDGHFFAAEAMEHGAAAVVCEETTLLPKGIPHIQTADTHAALAKLCSRFYGDPGKKLRLIAVTGTNGKTSVTHLLRGIFEKAGYSTAVSGTIGNFAGGEFRSNGGMTTLDPERLYAALARFADLGVQWVFLEASSHALALQKLAPLNFHMGIFTNLTPEHLDFHKTMEAYAAAKASLFSRCELGLFSADSPYTAKMTAAAACRSYTFSTQAEPAGADFIATAKESLGEAGIRYVFSGNGHSFPITCPVPGSFTYDNTLAAAAAACLCGIPSEVIRSALEVFPGVRGRMERILLPGAPFAVFLDYAHTPDALERLLTSVRGFRRAGQRIVLLFGCGGDRDRSKRAPMGRIASELADLVIVTADNSRSEPPARIFSEILSGIDPARPHLLIGDRRRAIFHAIATARAGDLLVLAGKGHEDYEIRADGKHPFAERAIVAEAYHTYYPSPKGDSHEAFPSA